MEQIPPKSKFYTDRPSASPLFWFMVMIILTAGQLYYYNVRIKEIKESGIAVEEQKTMKGGYPIRYAATGVYVNVLRDTQWVSVDITDLTEEELREFLSSEPNMMMANYITTLSNVVRKFCIELNRPHVKTREELKAEEMTMGGHLEKALIQCPSIPKSMGLSKDLPVLYLGDDGLESIETHGISTVWKDPGNKINPRYSNAYIPVKRIRNLIELALKTENAPSAEWFLDELEKMIEDVKDNEG